MATLRRRGLTTPPHPRTELFSPFLPFTHDIYHLSYVYMFTTQNTPSSSSNFEALFDAALDNYIKRTGQDLRNHPLITVIDRCQSPNEILAIFQEQSRAFDEFRNGDPKLLSWLTPAVNGLHAISTNAALSAGASLVSPPWLRILLSTCSNAYLQAFPPANFIFSGIGVLLSVRVTLSLFSGFADFCFYYSQTAKYVRESYDTLVDVFECIENFTRRLKVYTNREIVHTPAMTETIIKILIEMLAVLALATKQINQGRLSKSLYYCDNA
jgi:hypothetical protein